MSAPERFARIITGVLLAGSSLAALGAGGLQPPADDELWPSLRARITIQTAAVSPLSLSGLSDGGQGVRGGAVLGDYVFAEPSFGSFRATSGLVFGSHAGAPNTSFTAPGASRLGLTINQGRSLPTAQADPWQAAPYLGLGFSSPLGEGGFSLSADVGLVAQSVEPASALLRTPLGVQGIDNQRRELRLSPLLQLGMRYTF